MRHKSRLLSCVLMSALCVSGCQKTPPPLKGKREDVFVLQGMISERAKGPPPLVGAYKASSGQSWPMPYVTLHNNQTPVSMNAGAELKKAWSHTKGQQTDAYALMPPVVAGGRLYFVSGKGVLYCLDPKTGDALWSHRLTSKDVSFILGGGCAVSAGRVYAASVEGACDVLEAATGKVLWHHNVAQLLRAAPKVSGGRVFLATVRNQLDVLDAANGKPLWTHQGVPEELQFLGSSLPAISGDDVVVCYSSGEIHKLNAKTGRSLWSYVLSPDVQVEELSKIPHIVASPIVQGNVVYVTGSFQKTIALDLTTGTVLWEKNVGGLETPVVLANSLFLVQRDELVRMDRKSGHVWWSKPLKVADAKDDKSSHLWMGPLVLNDTLYVLSDRGDLRAFSMQDGRDLGIKASLKTACSVRPIAAEGHIFVLTKHSVVHALKAG